MARETVVASEIGQSRKISSFMMFKKLCNVQIKSQGTTGTLLIPWEPIKWTGAWKMKLGNIPKWSYYRDGERTNHQLADSLKSNSHKAPNYGLLLMSISSKPNYHNCFWQPTIIGWIDKKVRKAPCLFLSETFSIEFLCATQKCLLKMKEEEEEEMKICKTEIHEKLLCFALCLSSCLGAIWD